MITIRMTADVPADRKLVLTLPPEVPAGEAEVVVTVGRLPARLRPRTSLAEWAEAHAEDWGHRLSSEDVEGFTGRRF